MKLLSSIFKRFGLKRFTKGEKLTADTISLNHQRIFILPTKNGLGFVTLITVLLLIAFVYNNNLIYILAFLLASVFFVSIIHSFKALAGLTITKGKTNNAFAGEAVPFNVYLENSAENERFSLQINLSGSTSIQTHLAASEKSSIILYAPTHQRGWQPCGTITVSSTFPLGLFRAWAPINFDYKALIYPKPSLSDIPFPESTNLSSGTGMIKKSREDFFGLNQYQPGDSIRQIHWKTFAKGQGLHSKNFIAQRNPKIWLEYQNTPGRDPEDRLSQLCRWLIDAEQAGLDYGLNIPHIRKPPANGTQHFHDCLTALALF